MVRYYKLGKSRLTGLLGCLFFMAILSSCQEGREAGDLLGQWRMEGTGNSYMNFSGSVVSLRIPGQIEVFGTFLHVGDSLFMQCRSINSAAADTAFVEQTVGFAPFADIRLRIATLKSGKLVLAKGEKTWTMEKY